MSYACCPALGSDALTIWRTLSEQGELVRSSILRPSPTMWPDWASMALVTFPERKVTRLRGRNPAIQKTLGHGQPRRYPPQAKFQMWKNQDGFPITTVGNDRVGENVYFRSVVSSLDDGEELFECQKVRLDKPLKYYFHEST